MKCGGAASGVPEPELRQTLAPISIIMSRVTTRGQVERPPALHERGQIMTGATCNMRTWTGNILVRVRRVLHENPSSFCHHHKIHPR